MSLRELVKPESPGVYIMRDERGKVLYVGKAINLRQRINQYLGLQDSREFIPRLVSELADIEYILTNDEREALLVERQLIRKLRPRYNVLLRDDKNFLLVRLDGGHPFPRFEFVRRRRKDRARYFGPFPPAKVLRQYVRFLSKAFRLRLCGDRQLAQRIRPCLYHGTGSCSAPCWLPEANLDYRERLDAAAALLGRKTSEARRLVEQSMLQASAAERYEEAARFRDLLFALDGLWGEHGTAIQGTAEADVFAIHRGPLGGALFALHVREGVVTGHQAVFNELFYNSQTCDFDSLVYQYYENRTPPALVIGPFPPETVGALTSLLAEEHGRKMELVNPGKGDRRALLDMAQANAKLAYERESARALARLELLAALAAAFDLPSAPAVIECVDISSFQGGDAVGTVAVARDGLPAPSEYRSFHIRGATDDDCAMMAEVVSRRLAQVADSGEARILLLDGGRAHLARVLPLIPDGLPVFPAAIAKARPEQGLEHDRIFLPGAKAPVPLEPGSRVLLFLSALRDEAHRFSVAFHRKKRAKRHLRSPLLAIPGIGPRRRVQLIRHFGSLGAIRKASLAALQCVPGLPTSVAERIYLALKNDE